MPPDTGSSSKCNSAGRVTARLLLSFLALSATVTARKNDAADVKLGANQLPAIQPTFPGSEGDASPGNDGAERFVCHILPHIMKGVLTDACAARPFGIFSTMGHIDTPTYTDGKTSSTQGHSYIRYLRMARRKKCHHL